MPQQRPLPKSLRECLPEKRVLVNGDEHRLHDGCSVQALLVELGLAGKRVAVALNREVVPRSSYAEVALCSGDHVEILEAVGGG